ncbi:MAG: ankyrin repeat domain-containing protein [Verrucomicrobia bacterium]|nr:ankyrin repeat domain-containing protein [Verrucomicrobiota bacterium]
MKTISSAFAFCFLAFSTATGFCADPLSDAFRRGLFEEEANQNLKAAIEAYESVLKQIDAQRKMAAATVFRLGECYRKLGRTNDAVAQYQRIVREFPDQDLLGNLSRQNLAGLGVQDETKAADKPELLDLPFPDEEATEIARLKELITHSPDLINTLKANAKPNNQTPLQNAAVQGQLKVAEFLLEAGADVNGKGYLDKTPLHWAAEAGNKSMVELLLTHGAEINAQDKNGSTPLLTAVSNGYRTVVEILIAAHADLNTKYGDWAIDNFRNLYGTAPLGIAARRGDRSIVDLLLGHGADVNLDQGGGVTPLHVAAFRGQDQICEILLKNSANVEAEINANIQFSISSDRDLVQYAPQPDPNEPRPKAVLACRGFSPLHLAVVGGRTDTVKVLINGGAKINSRGFDHETPLHVATQYGSPEVVRLLLESGAEVNAISRNNQKSPLQIAVEKGSEELVQLILEFKPNLETRDQNQMTPLLEAVSKQNLEIVRTLLTAGADSNATLPDGRTLLHLAILMRDKVLAEALLAHGADVFAVDGNGKTALDYTKPESPSSSAGVTSVPSRVVRSSIPGPASPTPAAPPSDLADLLRQAGAVDDPQRTNQIRIGRGDNYFPVFYKGTNDVNFYSLIELIGSYFDWFQAAQTPGGGKAGLRALEPLQFPDFANVVIKRFTSGKETEIRVNLETAIQQADCSGDVPLEWGDIVEVPEKEHKLDEPWNGLGPDTLSALQKCLSRSVQISVKGQWTMLSLNLFAKPPPYPSGYDSGLDLSSEEQVLLSELRRLTNPQNGTESRASLPASRSISGRQNPNAEAGWQTEPKTIESFRLKEVLLQSNLLLSSSDLSRVKVTRTDPITKERMEMVLNLETVDPKTDLWLRDGDAIEVPEK